MAKKTARLLKNAVLSARFDNRYCIFGKASMKDENFCSSGTDEGHEEPIVAMYKTVPIWSCIQRRYENSARMALCADFLNHMLSCLADLLPVLLLELLSRTPVFRRITENCQTVNRTLNAVKAVNSEFPIEINAPDPCPHSVNDTDASHKLCIGAGQNIALRAASFSFLKFSRRTPNRPAEVWMHPVQSIVNTVHSTSVKLLSRSTLIM